MIEIFSTGKTKLSKILPDLKQVDTYHVLDPDSIDNFLDLVLKAKPEYILGMGIYSGVDQEKIRIERFCTNKFRNSFIDSSRLIKLEIPYFLDEDDKFKLASGMGNSYCNLLSYKVTGFIDENNLETRFSFLHVPRSWSLEEVASVIDDKIRRTLV